jgi:hypothetical protein
VPGGGVIEMIIEEGTKPIVAPPQTVDPLKGMPRMPLTPGRQPQLSPTAPPPAPAPAPGT